MKLLKSKGFFIKSFFLLIFLSIFTIILSWGFWEPFAYNFMTKNFSSLHPASDNIVIIAIDDKSISYHRWPWPREYYAKIIDFLNTYSNPKVIGDDSIMANYDKENPLSDEKYFQALKRTHNIVVGFSPLDKGAFDEKRNKDYLKKFYDKFHVNSKVLYPEYMSQTMYNGLSEFPDKYFNSVDKVGSVNVVRNSIGYLTVMDQAVDVAGEYYPSLALRMYLYLNNTNEFTVYPDKIIVDKTGLTIPSFTTPSGQRNYIRFYTQKNGDYTYKKYSASDIIKSYENMKKGLPPIINPEEFNGKIVFIGGNAKAAALGLEDALPTPMQLKHPGVDIQATNLNNLIMSDFMKLSSPLFELFILVLMSILTFVIISLLPIFPALLTLIAIAILYVIIAAICFYNGYAINIFTPLSIELVTTIFGYSYRFVVEGKNKEKIKQAMGKYISQDVMRNVVQNIDEIKLGGKRAVVTVLFSDIRGFTRMSENMTAEDVSKILNEYFSEMEPIITSYNGVINKFIGDAVMAIFGEPVQDLNHPVNAVKCAYAMLKKVEELQEKWLFEGKPKIEIGIGINTGEAFVGNIGSEKRLEYTVIGDTVNLASRIEGYNKVYHTNFLVSSSTYKYISDIADVIKISEVSIRGKSKKMDIYEVLRLNCEKNN